jgi:dolichol-phosphate mannosyltransferase
MRELRRLSVVIPVHNEEENLVPLYERLVRVLDPLSCVWELIFVDDGSTDHSELLLRELHARDRRVKVLFFTRNFGHERALTAGMDMPQGDAVVLMDADLQDPPEVIPLLIEQWRAGFDLVGARRTSRRGETRVKRFAAYVFYRIMRKLAPWEVPLDTGNFCLMDRKVVQAFRRCREWNRFVRVLLSWTGFSQTTVSFDRAPRHAGATKYSLRKQFSLAVTSLTSFSLLPLRFVAGLGVTIAALSALALVVCGALALLGHPVSGIVFLGLSVWFLGGVQCLLLGVVGEYVGRTFMETQRRPLYFLRDTLGFEAPALSRQAPDFLESWP